jgi:hypothetical protein
MPGKVQGDLKIMSLLDLLQWIDRTRKTGSLIFTRGREKKVIFFREGILIAANSNSPNDKIGQILIRMNKISREDLEEGLRLQKQSGDLIGDIFIAKGLHTTEDFVSALERQAAQIISSLFSWKEGEFIFHGKVPKERTILISVQIDSILSCFNEKKFSVKS